MTIRKIGFIFTLLLSSIALSNATTIPSGTRITVRLGSEISSASARAGQTWRGTVARDVVVHGRTIARTGDEVSGKITHAKSSGRLHDPGQLSLRLTSVKGQRVTSSRYARQGKSHTKGNVEKIGGGAAAGAVIGGIAGGGKGAAIGTLAGAGAGTGVAAATGKEEAVLPAESVMTFTITGGTSGSTSRSRK